MNYNKMIQISIPLRYNLEFVGRLERGLYEDFNSTKVQFGVPILTCQTHNPPHISIPLRYNLEGDKGEPGKSVTLFQFH